MSSIFSTGSRWLCYAPGWVASVCDQGWAQCRQGAHPPLFRFGGIGGPSIKFGFWRLGRLALVCWAPTCGLGSARAKEQLAEALASSGGALFCLDPALFRVALKPVTHDGPEWLAKPPKPEALNLHFSTLTT